MKKCVIKRKLKFENYRNGLEATKLENKYNIYTINIHSLKKNHKEFIRNNKSILKTEKRFKSETRNVFTEKISKTALSSNDDKSIFQ